MRLQHIAWTVPFALLLLAACRKDETQATGAEAYFYQGVLYDASGATISGHTIAVEDHAALAQSLQTDASGRFGSTIMWAPHAPPHYVTPPASNAVDLTAVVNAGVDQWVGWHRFTYGELSSESVLQTDIHLSEPGTIRVEVVDASQVGELRLTVQHAVTTDTFYYAHAATGGFDTTFFIKAYPQRPIYLLGSLPGTSLRDTAMAGSGETATVVLSF